LVTLLVHKIFDKSQDIRLHQKNMKNGFSGRSIDTSEITPTLKKLALPCMAESGWLTRSLEQPYPYNLNYLGKIGGKNVKSSFLIILDKIQNNTVQPEDLLKKMLGLVYEETLKNNIQIEGLTLSEELLISQIIEVLKKQFFNKYNISGGSKLPVIAIHSLMALMISELSRYKNCHLGELGNHNASDRTSNTAGDIEILKRGNLFEVFEIKLDKPIDAHLVRLVQDKIYRFNPTRYYILSCIENINDLDEIKNLIDETRRNHGCQIIVNGVLHTIKYYLRLLENSKYFLDVYCKNIQNDAELKREHKNYLNQIISTLNLGEWEL
jgi:DNA (cytosine-5)-methyltransferase 1